MSPNASSKSKSSRRRGGKSSSSNIGLWIVGISAAVVILVVAIMVVTSNRQTASAIAAPDVSPEWLDRSAMGNPEATVVIQTWEDYLCPACRQWAQQVKPRVIEDLVKPGLVRMEFKHFPLQSHAPGSTMAALASECAADQGGFWVYHDRLFQVQDRGQPAYAFDRLVEYANELGLNGNELAQCMTSQRYAAQVNDSFNQAISQGLNATPSVVINGKVMQNPFDYAEIRAEVDQLLESSATSN
jgi:protein-disulfide isomerase